MSTGSPEIRTIRRIGFLALNEFAMAGLSCAIEVLRMANHLIGRREYTWSVITAAGTSARSCDGSTEARAVGYGEAGTLDLVLVCGGTNVSRFVDEGVIGLVRRMGRDGVALGGLGTGTYALLKAGLMDGYRCTIAWQDMTALREEFAGVLFEDAPFVVDRNRMTCTGGMAPIDLMLSLVGSCFGRATADDISDLFAIGKARDGDDPEAAIDRARLEHAALGDVLALMEANLEEPLTGRELARLVGLSLRQVQRLFRAALGTTPARHYLRLRLAHARRLLAESGLSITDISLCCGFESPGHFSKSYRELYGRTPSSERQRAISSATRKQRGRRSASGRAGISQ